MREFLDAVNNFAKLEGLGLGEFVDAFDEDARDDVRDSLDNAAIRLWGRALATLAQMATHPWPPRSMGSSRRGSCWRGQGCGWRRVGARMRWCDAV
jgi:hypothetical protein